MNDTQKQIVDIFEIDKPYFEGKEWVACYSKYAEERFCFKEGNWNLQVSDLVPKDLNASSSKELKPFYEWLGKRVEFALI